MKVEVYFLEHEIPVFYITAHAFPDGVLEAHQELHRLIPFSEKRRYFGLSRPENHDGIAYKAAAEKLSTDDKNIKASLLTIPPGKYLGILVKDYMKDLPSIGNAFQYLIKQPDLDPQGYCIEWYLTTEDVRCMIKLNEQQDER